MTSWLSQPAFFAYAIAAVVLGANLMFLWFYSAFARAMTKTAMNEEDAAKFGARLVDSDPPSVARALRAHDNAQANIYPFLFLGLVFVMAGGSATVAGIVFAVFAVARWLHTLAYLRGWQPWRTIFFLAGATCIFVLLIGISWLLVRAG